MKNTKISKSQKIAKLKQELRDLEAQSNSALYFAYKEINKCSLDKMSGGGIILDLRGLGGNPVCAPFMISNGLSQKTIDSLKEDMYRSAEYSSDFILKSVKQ